MLSERGKASGGGRWYPTALTLPCGQVAVMGGHPKGDDTRHSNYMVELFDPALNIWSDAGDEPQNVIDAILQQGSPEIYRACTSFRTEECSAPY